MTKLRHPAVLFAAICATALIALSPAAAATQASPACGDTITTSTTLTHNLDCSAGGTEGLVIEGDGITLNLGGHWIKGAGGADGHAGVFIDGGSDVTVRGGTILNFFVDAEANSTTSATFFKLSLKTDGTQSYFPLYASHDSGTTVDHVATRNGSTGFFLDGSTNDNVTRSLDVQSIIGFYDQNSTGDGYSSDVATGELAYGFGTYAVAGASFTQNKAVGADYGFEDSLSQGGSYVANQALSSTSDGFYFDGEDAGAYVVQDNLARASGGNGFTFYGAAVVSCSCSTDTGSVVTGNKALGSFSDGFYDDNSINSTWSNNVANRNGEFGFELNEPQGDTISGNVGTSNEYAGIYLEDNDPDAGFAPAAFTGNTAKHNRSYGMWADFPQPGSANVASGNVPYDCFNITCQASATVALAPPARRAAPQHRLSGPRVARPHVHR